MTGRDADTGRGPTASLGRVAATIRVGTCSWADEALTKYWYPKGVPAGARLAWYAEHFDTVEVDSTYYRLPAEEMVQRWAERTPDGFVMHVKAFGVMTRHPVKIEQLPPDLRDEAPQDERGRVDRPSREFRAEIFRRFLEALEPLRAAGKLGGLLFQFPPYVVPQGGVATTTWPGRASRSGTTRCSSSSGTAAGTRRISARRRCASSRSTRCRTSSSTRRAARARTSR